MPKFRSLKNRPLIIELAVSKITLDRRQSKPKHIHNENTPMQYPAIFHGCKNVHLQMKIFNIFSSPEPLRSQGELIIYPSSRRTSVGVRPLASVVRPPFLKISSETTWPIKAKFYVGLSWEGRTKVCINGRGHMTKMPAMPIYGKNPSKIFFSGPCGPISTKFGM